MWSSASASCSCVTPIRPRLSASAAMTSASRSSRPRNPLSELRPGPTVPRRRTGRSLPRTCAARSQGSNRTLRNLRSRRSLHRKATFVRISRGGRGASPGEPPVAPRPRPATRIGYTRWQCWRKSPRRGQRSRLQVRVNLVQPRIFGAAIAASWFRCFTTGFPIASSSRMQTAESALSFHQQPAAATSPFANP